MPSYQGRDYVNDWRAERLSSMVVFDQPPYVARSAPPPQVIYVAGPAPPPKIERIVERVEIPVRVEVPVEVIKEIPVEVLVPTPIMPTDVRCDCCRRALMTPKAATRGRCGLCACFTWWATLCDYSFGAKR